MNNTTKTLNTFIDMVDTEGSVIKVTDTMTLVTDVDGRKAKVYTHNLVNHIRVRDMVRANDALAYTKAIQDKSNSTITKEKKMECKVKILDGADFGPIRYCTECGNKVESVGLYDEDCDIDTWKCPECGDRHVYDKDVYTDNVEAEICYDPDNPEYTRSNNVDFFDGYKWTNREYLKKNPEVAKWLKANRKKMSDIKSEWVDSDELSLNMDFGNDDVSVMRDVSPTEHQMMLDYSTRMTEVSDRKVIGLRTGFRRNMLRNPKVAMARLDALRPLVCKDEIERLEYMLEDITSLYEHIFKSKVCMSLNSGIIDISWVNSNKYNLKGKMWKYSSMMNKMYWISADSRPQVNRRFNLTPEGNKCKYQSCATCSASDMCSRMSTSKKRKFTDKQTVDSMEYGETDYAPEYPTNK